MVSKEQVIVAVANFRDRWGDKKENLARMCRLCEEAETRQVDIIAFPELALTGYEVEPEASMHKKLAETIPGPSTDVMAKEALKHKLHILFGMPERDKDSPSFLNSAVVIGPEGNIISVHRKAHPWVPERAWSAEGPGTYEAIETEFGLMGVMICYETYMFPEVARILALKGARLLFNMTAACEYEGWNMLPFMLQQVRARATENLVYVASTNLVGQELELEYLGNSLITGPNYPSLVFDYAGPASRTDSELLVATLDLQKLNEMWKEVPHFKDRRPETYSFLLKEGTKDCLS